MNPESVDFKILGGLVGTVGSLVTVLIWLVKSSLPKLLETYRQDILAGQQHLKDSLERAEQGLIDARKEFLQELHQKRTEYVSAIKEERQEFLQELGRQSAITHELAAAVRELATRVDVISKRFDGTPHR